MGSRLAKQLFYGGIFLGILLSIFVAIYFISFREGPTCFDGKLNQNEEKIDCGGVCIPCALRDVKPIVAAPVDILSFDGRALAVLRFTNPNVLYGAQKFLYDATFFGVGEKVLYTATGESFIYPGETDKTIILANLPFDKSAIVGNPTVIVKDFEWTSVQEFSKPDLSVREQSTALPENADAIVTGVIVNNNPTPLPRVDVGVVIYNRKKFVAGASRTVVFDVGSFGERFFKILVPISEGEEIDPRETDIFLNALLQ